MLLYGFSVGAHCHSDNLSNPDRDEVGLSCALDMHKEAKLIKLLRNASMEIDDEGQLPPTPPIFEELWASSEAHRIYTHKEGNNTRGLGYTPKTTRFTRVSKAPEYSCNDAAMVIEDLSILRLKMNCCSHLKGTAKLHRTLKPLKLRLPQLTKMKSLKQPLLQDN